MKFLRLESKRRTHPTLAFKSSGLAATIGNTVASMQGVNAIKLSVAYPPD